MTVGLPGVLLGVAATVLFVLPGAVAATVGVGGLAGGLLAVYAGTGLVLWRAYTRRRRRITRSAGGHRSND